MAPGPELGPQVCVTLALAHLARRGQASATKSPCPARRSSLSPVNETASKSTGFPGTEAELLRENARVRQSCFSEYEGLEF